MSADFNSQRLMAIDPGAKRIGIAISDLSGTIAKPLVVINHLSRTIDTQKIVELAAQYQVIKIIIGLSRDEDGVPSQSGRSALRLAEEISKQSPLTIEFLDEEGTTNAAQGVAFNVGLSKKKRKGHHDDLAAAILLQAYIERSKFSNMAT